jgi:hypothetical protein
MLHVAQLPSWPAILAPRKMITMYVYITITLLKITCIQLVVTTIRDYLNKIARNSQAPALSMHVPAVIPRNESRVRAMLVFSVEGLMNE